VIDKTWVVAHNTYTELSAEAGFLALFLFLWALKCSFKNVSDARKSEKYKTDPDYRLFTQALFAGMMAYVVGGCFASTEYNLYPYVMIGYTCVLVRLGQPVVEKGKEKVLTKAAFVSDKPRPVWGR
jgi:putative Mn2+ efflux pump MntP